MIKQNLHAVCPVAGLLECVIAHHRQWWCFSLLKLCMRGCPVSALVLFICVVVPSACLAFYREEGVGLCPNRNAAVKKPEGSGVVRNSVGRIGGRSMFLFLGLVVGLEDCE